MTTPESVNSEYINLLLQRAGLQVSPTDLEKLLPMYRTMMEQQIALLHDPSLPLGESAAVFHPDWPQQP